jgi:hypothetical protein
LARGAALAGRVSQISWHKSLGAKLLDRHRPLGKRGDRPGREAGAQTELFKKQRFEY